MGSEAGPGVFHEILGKEQSLEGLLVPAQMLWPSPRTLQIQCKPFSLRFRTPWPGPSLSVISPDPSHPTSAAKPVNLQFLDYATLCFSLPLMCLLCLLPLVSVSPEIPPAPSLKLSLASGAEPHHLGLYLSPCMALTLGVGIGLTGWFLLWAGSALGRAWRSFTSSRWRAEWSVPDLKGPQQHWDKQGWGKPLVHSDKVTVVGGQKERGN